jgi:hypothetical protein
MTSPIESIKSKFTLRGVAEYLGVPLPRDGVKFRSPFRADQNPSCTVKEELFTDWSTNEHLDAIAFYAAAKSLTNAEAIKELAAIAGHKSQPKTKVKVATQPMKTKPIHSKPPIPEPIESPTLKLIIRTAESRQLSPEAFDCARVIFQTLGFCRLFNQSCWYLTDRMAPGWEARRCDNLPFDPVGNQGERKSHSKGTGIKAWPVGIAPAGFDDTIIDELNPTILLVEGGPDYVAAIDLCLNFPMTPVLPCAMLGKSADIATDALPRFKKRRVVILGHSDAADRMDAWGNQIREAGAKQVLPVQLGCMDLNDLVSLRPETLPVLAHKIGIFHQ